MRRTLSRSALARLALALPLLLAVAACSRTPTSYEGRIYLSRQDKGEFFMEWVDPEGVEVHPLLQDQKDVRGPVPSPDGGRLAFLKGSPPRVHVASALTWRDDQLSTYAHSCARAVWSPGIAPELAYLRFPPSGRAELVVQPLSGSARVVHEARGLGGLGWSRLGDRIYFTEMDGESTPHVWSVKTDGSERRRLLKGVSDPCLSPDGESLAVAAPGQIQVHDLKTRQFRVLVDQPGRRLSMPSWSPNSSRLAFLQDDQVWVIERKGGTPRQLTRLSGGVMDAWWGKGP